MDNNQVSPIKTLVSILMLTYNRARYIDEAIRSVTKQSYQNWELIIIDDGSTDQTEEIVRAYTDPRIRYIKHESNHGLLVRRQESLTYATGDYIAVLDSDDVWLDQEKLSQQVGYLENHPECVLVGTAITHLNQAGEPVGSKHYALEDTAIRAQILIRNQFAHSSVLMRTSAVKQTAGYRYPLAEDLDLFLQLGHLGTFANLPSALTGYRVHAGTASSRKQEMIKTVLAITKLHRNQYPGYYLCFLKYRLSALFL